MNHVALVILAGTLLSACARPGAAPPASFNAYATTNTPPYQIGLATYYHDSLSGNLTANGELYDPNVISAAHRELPFDTVVDVVRRDGRAIRVRVNDRGLFADGRIIDLSRQAATLLDSVQAGVVEVSLFIVYMPAVPERTRRGAGSAGHMSFEAVKTVLGGGYVAQSKARARGKRG